jgi:hypothetical protein
MRSLSSLRAMRAVEFAISMLRDEKARSPERLGQLGLTLHTLVTSDDCYSWTPRIQGRAEVFLPDPAAWSANHGGRTASI